MKKINLGEFRNALRKYHHFLVSAGDVLSPIKVEGRFDRAAVNMAPNEYIAFKVGEDVSLVVRHITEIKCSPDGDEYVISCAVYQDHPNAEPYTVEYSIMCI